MEKRSKKSRTDWSRVRAEARAGAPVAFEPKADPYDPNDAKAVAAFWRGAKVRRPGQRGPQKAPTKQQVTLRLDRELLAHFRRGGRGWQTRLNDSLKRLVSRGR
ncbi:MAG: BrnA antitoxin family protein [Betaproteobacteria bacterium]